MDTGLKETLIGWAEEYNDPKYFEEDPIAFPRQFAKKYRAGEASLADVEISALLSAHLAWGRRAMIVRDCGRMFDEMCWKPYDYVMAGDWRDENASLHRQSNGANLQPYAHVCVNFTCSQAASRGCQTPTYAARCSDRKKTARPRTRKSA